MMDVNSGLISGAVTRIESLSTRNGNEYVSVEMDVAMFVGGQEGTSHFCFPIFGEAAKVAKTLVPGDRACVQFRLRINQKGYADLQTTGVIPLERSMAGMAQASFQPQYCHQGRADVLPF